MIDVEAMVKFVIPIQRTIWLVVAWQRSVHAYGRGYWKPIRSFGDEASALAYLADIRPDVQRHRRIIKGVIWETQPVWVERRELEERP